MRQKKPFIKGKAARRVRREIISRRKIEHPQKELESSNIGENTPGWAKAFWDDLSKSPPDFAKSFINSLE